MAFRDHLARMERWQRDLEDELAKERADALGRAGRRLVEALESYRAAIAAAEAELPGAPPQPPAGSP